MNDIYSITSRTKRYILLVASVFVILLLEGYFKILQDEIIQGPNIKKWICQGCNKSFNSKRAVKQHQRRRNCGRNEVVWKNIAMFNYAYYLLFTYSGILSINYIRLGVNIILVHSNRDLLCTGIFLFIIIPLKYLICLGKLK